MLLYLLELMAYILARLIFSISTLNFQQWQLTTVQKKLGSTQSGPKTILEVSANRPH